MWRNVGRTLFVAALLSVGMGTADAQPFGPPQGRSTEGCPQGFSDTHGQFVSSTEESSREEAAESECGKPLDGDEVNGNGPSFADQTGDSGALEAESREAERDAERAEREVEREERRLEREQERADREAEREQLRAEREALRDASG